MSTFTDALDYLEKTFGIDAAKRAILEYEMARIMGQRDELTAALREIRDYDSGHPVVEIAKAALKRVEEVGP